MSRTAVIMAGGTGGHIFPGLAVADALKHKGWNIEWLGTPDRMEAQLVPSHGYSFNGIKIKGLRGHGVMRKLMAPFAIVQAILQARQLFKRIKPDLVIGMGGYASGPGGVAARSLGIPLVLHEQNAVPGMTNKLLAKIADRVLCAFPDTFEQPQAALVGNPVRAELHQVARNPLELEQRQGLNVLVLGGSLGARALNQQVPLALKEVYSEMAVNIWHQAGKDNADSVKRAYQEFWQGQGNLRVDDFINNMAEAYHWADLVICRAGALTVSEVAAVGIAAIFVPLPHAVDDHQTKNALSLVDRDAALLLPQQELEQGELAGVLTRLNQNRQQIISMAVNALECAEPEATHKVVEISEELVV